MLHCLQLVTVQLVDQLCVEFCAGAVFHLWSYPGLVGYRFGLRVGCGDSSSDEAESSVGTCCHLFHLFVPAEI